MDQIQDKVIEQLYREMYSQLVIYAYSILQNNALAEEAVQETFRIACGKTSNLMESYNQKGWIVNTLKNVINNMLRSRASLNTLVVASLSEYNWELPGASDEISIDVLYGDISHTNEYKLI